MRNTDRRKMMQLLVAAALASPFAAQPVAAATTLINPPTGPMLYRRTLERVLADGAKITAMREFAISFQRFSGGFIVDGQQSAVEVTAPAGLERFVELEKARVETGLFPLSLDPLGIVTSLERSQPASAEVEHAFDEVSRHIAEQPFSVTERDELRQLISAIHQAGTKLTTHIPFDLFAPCDTERREDQTIALPTGEQGRVQSRFGGERDGATGLMRLASREVLTEIDQDRRLTREMWQLTPA